MRLIRLTLIALLLAGCAAAAFPPLLLDPPDGYARIFAYRTARDVSAVWAHHFRIDEKAAADLIPGRYSHFLVRAGARRARVGDARGTHRPAIAFNAESGKTYYFRYGSPATPDAIAGRVGPEAHAGPLAQVTEAFARSELEQYRFQKPAADRIE